MEARYLTVVGENAVNIRSFLQSTGLVSARGSWGRREKTDALAAFGRGCGDLAEGVLDCRENGLLVKLTRAIPQVRQVSLVHSVLCIAGGGLRDTVKLPLLPIVHKLKLAILIEPQLAHSQIQLRRVPCLHRVLNSHHNLLQDVYDCLLHGFRHFSD